MAVALYMDHHVSRAITAALRRRGVDVITAYEDGASRFADPRLLDRATELGRALFTEDDDLLAEAARRQRAVIPFGGIIYVDSLEVSVGVCIKDLEIIGLAGEPKDVRNQVLYLPL